MLILPRDFDRRHSQTPEEWMASSCRTLCLYGPIVLLGGDATPYVTGFSPTGIMDSLIVMDKMNHEPIKIIIQSPGGILDTVMPLYDTIKCLKSEVWTISRMSASAAVLVLCAGTPGRRYVYPSTKVFIHQPFANLGVVSETQSRVAQRELTKYLTQVATLFKANGAVPSINQMIGDMRKEKYLTAEEAIKYGLADKMVEGEIL